MGLNEGLFGGLQSYKETELTLFKCSVAENWLFELNVDSDFFSLMFILHALMMMTIVIVLSDAFNITTSARVYVICLVTLEQRRAAADPQTKT